MVYLLITEAFSITFGSLLVISRPSSIIHRSLLVIPSLFLIIPGLFKNPGIIAIE
jgi:hypothetical protein